ncbi:MAG: type II toxin-antitoxin system antitoxin, RelB/DinJ family [Sulfobacillus thermosulfidooxidans]|uniref:type II toxin-antitoxin system RelB/DinJ family antitoxin n=1 Tax=Sulfobacillus TaxID=28033 RepID=UPI000CD0D95F|nr:type II toxin-antitoxin system RelB/DinJ family antitoxin [Sulfobacillus sp. hq2]POB10272.1 type II toxin-antitoxin system antitoxin, RelB/DinJ family [Sulfobacillus sp. hq2]PSR35608.1 MAG: type II toxin-antitoxin system antitoxin, RelB/DinJ family [Sulfobacillus thermosulfidooxidans]
MKANTIVRARIPAETKEKALAVLEKMGLTASDLIRLTFLRVAEEERLPFAVAVPNHTTREAMDEIENGGGHSFQKLDDLFHRFPQ